MPPGSALYSRSAGELLAAGKMQRSEAVPAGRAGTPGTRARRAFSAVEYLEYDGVPSTSAWGSSAHPVAEVGRTISPERLAEELLAEDDAWVHTHTPLFIARGARAGAAGSGGGGGRRRTKRAPPPPLPPSPTGVDASYAQLAAKVEQLDEQLEQFRTASAAAAALATRRTRSKAPKAASAPSTLDAAPAKRTISWEGQPKAGRPKPSGKGA